jgi:hypothetical protein
MDVDEDMEVVKPTLLSTLSHAATTPIAITTADDITILSKRNDRVDEEWSTNIFTSLMQDKDAQREVALRMKHSVRAGRHFPFDFEDKHWANYPYRICTFFYNKISHEIVFGTEESYNIQQVVYPESVGINPKLIIAAVIKAVSNIYTIQNPALNDRRLFIKVIVDLYFTRPPGEASVDPRKPYTAYFHKDSGTNQHIRQTKTTHRAQGHDNIEYVSLLYLSSDPERILKGTTVIPTMANATGYADAPCALTCSVKNGVTIIFNDTLLTHSTPHVNLVVKPESVGSQPLLIHLNKDGEDIVALTEPPSILEGADPDAIRRLEAGFRESRAFVRNHFIFETINQPEIEIRNPIHIGVFLERYIKANPELESVVDGTALYSSIMRMIETNDKIMGGEITKADFMQETYSYVAKIKDISDATELNTCFSTLSKSHLALGKNRNKNKKTKRNKYKRTKRRKTKRRRR